MERMIKGRAAVVGEYVSGDVILPARHAFLDPEGMAAHVLEELDPTANARVRSSPILIAGTAFGYGTGRESSARALRAAGVRVVIGGPFARMFFRNAVNNGLLVLDCPALVASRVADGASVEVDLEANEIRCDGRIYLFPPVAPIVRRIIGAGGLIEYGRRLIGAGQGISPDA